MSMEDLTKMVGETVLVRKMDGNKIAGELQSVDENYALTLTENGGPEADDDGFTLGDTNYENIDGERVLNWEAVESVERLADYR